MSLSSQRSQTGFLLLREEGRAGCWMFPSPIPKGLHHPAQGCAPRATLGNADENSSNPEGVESSPTLAHEVRWLQTMQPLQGCIPSPTPTQGSSPRATLGNAPGNSSNPEGVVSSPTLAHEVRWLQTMQPLQGCIPSPTRTQGSSQARNPGLSDSILSGWGFVRRVRGQGKPSFATPGNSTSPFRSPLSIH